MADLNMTNVGVPELGIFMPALKNRFQLIFIERSTKSYYKNLTIQAISYEYDIIEQHLKVEIEIDCQLKALNDILNMKRSLVTIDCVCDILDGNTTILSRLIFPSLSLKSGKLEFNYAKGEVVSTILDFKVGRTVEAVSNENGNIKPIYH